MIFWADFVVTDLALASQSIPTFTISSLSLLSTVLESHPPSAIVTNAEFLPHVLELIYDSNEHNHHTVIVAGELDAGKDYAKIAKHVNLIKFADIEKSGANGQLGLPQIGATLIANLNVRSS
jgi:long-chain acyl-CoA synthetase